MYLDLTFITLAMLVVGGATSLWGAVVGALAVSALDSYLAVAENGTSLFGWHIDLPAGDARDRRRRADGAVLILRPSGLTGGREFRLWPRPHDARLRRRRGRDRQPLRRAPRARRRGLGARRAARSTPRRCASTACGSAGAPTSPRGSTAATRPDALPEPDLVIVACKGTDLDAVAARLAGHWPDAT